MRIHVKVKPNSPKQEILKEDENHFVVKLKSVPEKGKANVELVKILRKYFKSPVEIKSGLSSRNKIIEIGE